MIQIVPSSSFLQDGAGAVSRTLQERGLDWVSVFDFIPVALHANIKNRTSTDDVTTCIQAAIDSIYTGVIYFPPGKYCITAPIELSSANFDRSVWLVGAGRIATVIIATAPFAAGTGLIHRGTTAVVIGGGLSNMWINANFNADYALELETGKNMYLESLYVTNANVTEAILGNAVTPRFYESNLVDCNFFNQNPTPASRSDYNLRLIGFATDNEIIRCGASNAKLANIRIEAGGNTVTLCHPFGFPSTMEADYCIQLGPNSSAVNNYCDGFAVAGIYMSGDDTAAIGNRFFWPSTTTGDAILCATSLDRVTALGSSYYSMPAARVPVAYAGTQPRDSMILDGLLGSDGVHMLLGYVASLPAIGSAHLQIAGTDFSTSGLGQGRWSADNQPPFKTFFKSRSATIGSFTIVQDDDLLGIMDFAGDDGVQQRTAVRLAAVVDGAPGSGDMPGRFEVYTAQDGGVTLTLRQSWDARGNVVIGSAAIATNATDGFLYVPGCAGTPTGTPTTYAGRVPVVVDTTNHKLYFYSGGAWRDAGP